MHHSTCCQSLVRLSSLDAKTILSRDQLEGLRQKTEVVDMPYSVGEKTVRYLYIHNIRSIMSDLLICWCLNHHAPSQITMSQPLFRVVSSNMLTFEGQYTCSCCCRKISLTMSIMMCIIDRRVDR